MFGRGIYRRPRNISDSATKGFRPSYNPNHLPFTTMRNLYFFLALISTLLCSAADRPNVLWLTSEDNSHHWLGCYGNDQAKTPNLDKMAAG